MRTNNVRFESLVNTEGFQTGQRNGKLRRKFESLVNTEGFQTDQLVSVFCEVFESLVNTEGFQTAYRSPFYSSGWCLSYMIATHTRLTTPNIVPRVNPNKNVIMLPPRYPLASERPFCS